MSKCRKCRHQNEVEICEGCYDNDAYEGYTNADRIRAMSDEELVNVIPCPYMKDDYDECRFGWHEPEMTCEQCKLQWLKSEVKE